MIYWILDIYFTHSAKRLLKIKEKKSKKKQKVLKVKFYQRSKDKFSENSIAPKYFKGNNLGGVTEAALALKKLDISALYLKI